MIEVPSPIRDIVGRLRDLGHRAYLTGGAVRDMQLGRLPRDWDVATSASGELVARSFDKVNPVGIRHNTVGVFHQGMWVEVTTFRDPGLTLDGDLALRDFTVNAMALDLESGSVIDPLDGAADLSAGRLRGCGDAAERFREDPLRMLRAARFYAELSLVPEVAITAATVAQKASVLRCAVERIREEWLKLIVGPSVREALLWLEQTGLLGILFPAITTSRGVEQNKWHRWDVFTHTIETVARAAPQAEVRMAALFHDLGKPATRRWKEGDWTFYSHERVSAEIASFDLERLRFGNEQRDRIVALVSHHMFHYAPEWSDAAVRRFLRRVSPELIDPLFELRRADSSAAGMGGEAETERNLHALRHRIEHELQANSALRIKDLAIDGNDVIALVGKSSSIIGVVLKAMLERVTDEPALNTRDRLLAEAEAFLKSQGHLP